MIVEPYNAARVYTKSDSVDIPPFDGAKASGIYVGGAGDVTVLLSDGTSVLFTAVPVGTILPIAVSRIMSTGTAGGPFVALFRI